MERTRSDFPVLQLHSGICLKQPNKPKQTKNNSQNNSQKKNRYKPKNAPREENGRRAWSVLDTQLLQGAEECWNIVLDLGSVGQQQLSCPAQSWGCAVLTVQLWGWAHRGLCWQQQHVEGEGGEGKVLSLPWHSCAAQKGPGGTGMVRTSHSLVCSPAGGFTGRSRPVALHPCYLAQGQEHRPAMAVCYLDT